MGVEQPRQRCQDRQVGNGTEEGAQDQTQLPAGGTWVPTTCKGHSARKDLRCCLRCCCCAWETEPRIFLARPG